MASKINVDKIARGSGTPEFTIPTADGAANTFLKTDGSGVLSFDNVTTTALTGSTNTWIPTITAANALTGTANFTYDGNTLDVKNSGTASSINLYCETGNAHYIKLKSGPHASATSYTLTLPNAPPSVSGQALTATDAGVGSWATVAGGKVLQVLMGTSSTAVINTTTTYVDTGLTVTITPSAATSKILILANHGTLAKKQNTTLHLKLLRDVTDINAWGTGWLVYSDSTTTLGISGTFTYMDSPNSTSAIVYKTQFKTEGSGSSKEVRVMPGPADGSIIALEIGA